MILSQVMRAYTRTTQPECGPDDVPEEFPGRRQSPGPDDVDDRRYDDRYDSSFPDPDGSGSYHGI